jgi:hypothetical protein
MEHIASIFRVEEAKKKLAEVDRKLSLPPFLLVFYVAYSWSLNMEPICASETSDSLRTTRVTC